MTKPSLTVILLAAALTIAVAALPLAAAASEVRVQKFLAYKNRTDNRSAYAHMTMPLLLPNGEMLLAFQASDIGEGHLNQKIYVVRSIDHGVTWSEPRVAVEADNVPVWGPAMIFSKGKIFMFCAISVPANIRPPLYDRHFPGGRIALVTSTDLGETWSSPLTLMDYHDTKYGLGNVSKMTANAPVFLDPEENAVALPFWCEPHYPENKNDTGRQQAALLFTRNIHAAQPQFDITRPTNAGDNTTHWLIENWVLSKTPVVAGAGLAQGFRTQAKWMYESVGTVDKGFAAASASPVPNPDSKTSAASMWSPASAWKQGKFPSAQLLACNPTTSSRKLLSLFRGVPDPLSWKQLVVIEDGLLDSDYPSVIQGRRPGEVLVSYTCQSHTAACLAVITGAY